MPYVPSLLLLAALLLLAWASRILATHARGGYDVSMGSAGVFSGIWLLGALCGSVGLGLASGLRGWPAVGLILLALAGLHLLRAPVYRAIVRRNLGRDAPPLPRDGFKEYLRRTRQDNSD